MPDTPSPLAAAAEALLKSRSTCCDCAGRGIDWRGFDGDLVDALRAALAADAAWRARAEAAVAVMEAEAAALAAARQCRREGEPEHVPRLAAFARAEDAAIAARRRYEETCRA